MHDPRPRLSVSQQAQILSDVQQHQQRYRRPTQDSKNSRVTSFPPYDQVQSSTPYASLAKYKVDRTKQQQLQQLLQQQQQVQQLLQRQQQKIAQQFSASNLVNGGGSVQTPQFQQQQYNNGQYNQNGFQNLHQDLSQPLFSDQQTLQLQEYLEKQRELELLQKQRQQLLYEQQELRKQQELLRLEQLQRLTSTTAPLSTATSAPVVVSTTSTPLLLSSPKARRITPSEAELFLKAIANHQKKYTTTAISTTSTTTTATTPSPSKHLINSKTQEISENLLGLIQDQENRLGQDKSKPQIKVIYQTDKPNTTQQNSGGKNRSSQQSTISERELLLKQLKLALAQSGDDDDVIRNVTTRDLILPNGKKIQLIHAPNGLPSIASSTGSSTVQTSSLLPSTTTTIKPPKAIFEELTKGGVLPPGADFEIIRQKSDGKLEEISKTPIIQNPAKKVTFVVLEEQPDGSYKVQGIKGNANDKESGTDVQSIVEKIKKGELKLPPSSFVSTTQPSTLEHFETSFDPNLVSAGTSRTSLQSVSTTAATFRPTTLRSTSKHSERYKHIIRLFT